MRCKIADLIVDVPEAGGMAPRCREYLTWDDAPADIVISEQDYTLDTWQLKDHSLACYMESGFHFYGNLLRFDGMLLHASAIAYEGRAYLFSGPSGVGKSTHTRLWQWSFGQNALVFNDDKPALRCLDGQWFAYGTPWCGKDGINRNMKVPVAGICFLKQAGQNRIRRLDVQEAIPLVLGQTHFRFRLAENMDRLLHQVDRLVCTVPMYELENLPDAAAVRLSYETMRAAATE